MTRKEQIELMKECIEDAEESLRTAHDPLLPPDLPALEVAFKFFDYRTRQRDKSDCPSLAKDAASGFMKNFGMEVLKHVKENERDIPCSSTDKTPDVEED